VRLQAFPAPAAITLDAFRVAASWVASRSFCVDAWHGAPRAQLLLGGGGWCGAASACVWLLLCLLDSS
jgi:hypothetical protein